MQPHPQGLVTGMTNLGMPAQPPPGPPMQQVSGVIAQPTPYVSRSRIYAFVVDETGMPIELGSGRFAKAYLGEERWLESKTDLRRPVAIKCLQRGVTGEDQMRFQMEKEILERVQGHPNIVELLASGEGDSAGFIPPSIRDKVENDFMILELLDMSLEERLKGARQKRRRDDLLAVPLRERIFRVLDYMIPVATRGRVRAPRSRHLPPRHQAGEHPRQAARSEPARLARCRSGSPTSTSASSPTRTSTSR